MNPSPPSASSTPGGPGDSGGAELSWPLTIWQGWNRFATTDPVVPPRPGDRPRTTEERLAYHSAFVTIRTPAIHALATQVRTLMILGRHQQTTARPSLIVTGPAAAGKTTALLNVGRTCHLAHTRKNPAPPGSAHAAYVLVPPGATAKTLITEFARYLGIPVTARMTQTQITEAVCHTYTHAGIQLVMIDEIHRLNPRTTTGAQTADLIKDLTERLPATFVYAGINVTDTPPLHRDAGRPTRRTHHPRRLRPPTRPPRHPPPLPRRHHRHRKPSRPPTARTRHPPPPHPIPPPAHRRPHRIPHKAHPPSSHHRHPRRHRTHHQTITRRGTARPPRRNPPPPPPKPIVHAHRAGRTALTSTNNNRPLHARTTYNRPSPTQHRTHKPSSGTPTHLSEPPIPPLSKPATHQASRLTRHQQTPLPALTRRAS
ncbi:ATP-binding protein [Streptomyces chumphonensis]|uniref:ATP-binding protein n=1 Tax=Streptomyces chumphonensis TaxID=1214925 RepID=UPI003D73F6D3